MSNQLIKGLPGEPALQGDFVITDTDSVTPLFKVAASGGAVTMAAAPVISGTAPSLALTDTTASAKSLTVAVDANKAQLRESAGAAGSLLVLDLANNRVGVATAAPAVALDVTGAVTASGDVTASAGLSVATSFALAGIEAGLIAHAGGTQAAALALNAAKIVHVVATVAAPADSIVLPASAGAGKSHVVMNSGANSLQIYGLATDTINGVAAATGVAIPAGKAAVLVDYAAGKWFMLLGA